MDRRIQKTRQAIINTFVTLLTEKGFDKITVNNINKTVKYIFTL